MPINDILNCAADEVESILDSDDADDHGRWFRWKGIGAIELSKLGELLDVDSYDELSEGFELVGEPRDEGPWPQTIPAALIERLAALTDAEIAAMVPKWVEMEEFEGSATVESLTEYLVRLRSYLSQRTGEFFLVNAL